jgi:3-methyladenine DNA glycosylase AlkD
LSLDAERAAAEIEANLRAVGTPERAEGEKRYLNSELTHLGAIMPQIRREVRSFARAHDDLDHDELIALVEALWSARVHETRMAATMLLEAYPMLLGPRDLTLIERLIRESRTWALVDGLAASVTGPILVRRPRSASRLDRWARDDDLWVRRSALLAMIEPLKGGADFGRFADYADAMLDEKEFFIRKAIGWVLREAARTRPNEVYEWLAPRTDRASGVTVREAVKYLEPKRREELLAAYREERPAGP